MWGRLGPRFAVEAAFLIVLAVGLGLADQDWVVIVAVMAAGWALVSLIELVASQRPTGQWVARDPAVEEQPPDEAVDVQAAPSAARPGAAPLPAEPSPPPPAADAAADRPPGETVEDTQEVPSSAGEDEPRRRWFRRRKDPEPETASEDGIPEPPKHVRRLDGDADAERTPAESAEGHS
jgi:hypothetical protein